VEYEKRSNSGLINTHGMNPEGGDMRQSRKQEERLENEASQAQRNFREIRAVEEEAELRVEATNRRAFLNADFNLELVQRFSILMKPWPPSVDRVYVERFLIYWMIRCQCQQRVNY